MWMTFKLIMVSVLYIKFLIENSSWYINCKPLCSKFSYLLKLEQQWRYNDFLNHVFTKAKISHEGAIAANEDVHVEVSDEGLHMNAISFLTIMKKSSIDNSSHGAVWILIYHYFKILEKKSSVENFNRFDIHISFNSLIIKNFVYFYYITNHVKPIDRQWVPNEKVTLRMGNSEWAVRLACSKGLPRCSAGWTKFVADNKLKYRKSYIFNLVNGEDNIIIFNVEKY